MRKSWSTKPQPIRTTNILSDICGTEEILYAVDQIINEITPNPAKNIKAKSTSNPKAHKLLAWTPTIYLVVAYRFNHIERNIPLDPRFSESDKNYVYYVVDATGAPADFPGKSVSEARLSKNLQAAGKSHIGEWSFLLNEYENRFATYPFFVISSRFYEKNQRLPGPLDPYWDKLFEYLDTYSFGYLPSYNRPVGFEDLKSYFFSKEGHLGMKKRGLDLMYSLYGVRFVKDYRYFSDFFCNYIGFANRQALENYVEFYKPLLNFFFNENYRLIRKYDDYVRRIGVYRGEKPLTFLIEMASHLYFYQNQLKFFGLSYDGFYEVDEYHTRLKLLEKLPSIG